ncbi:hypothetical protein ZOSMA_324G00180 [Zostera marina]|uniref:Uncharacterized protein n=1 Tax=Zostera marina TaxID=29655 RepID=A0A0K9PAZ7_ZOSMR|nr:hypothetical protein ZOSMA_324G00180 [Zostera marina]
MLVSLIFARDSRHYHLSSSPLCAQVLRIFSKYHRSTTHGSSSKKGGIFRKIFGGRKNKKTQPSDSVFRRLFGNDLAVKDIMKPVLIPCYDLTTGALFVFSRTDGMETTSYDFRGALSVIPN